MAINQRPTKRSQVIERQTADTTGFSDPNAGNGFAVLADFFGRQSKIEQEKDERAEMLKDNDALLELDMAAKRDPQAANDAVRTGDYSRFVGTERASRTHFQNQAPTILGRALALRDSKQYRLDAISQPPGTDLKQWSFDRFGATTKGMNVRGAAAYQAELEKYIPGIQNERIKALSNQSKIKATQNAVDLVNGALETADVYNVEEYNKIITASATSAAGNPFLETRASIQKVVDREVISGLATESDPGRMNRLLVLAHEVDPTDGQSILSRNKESSEEWSRIARQQMWGVRTAEFLNFENDFDAHLLAIEGGQTTPAEVLIKLESAIGDSMRADHPRADAMRNKLTKLVLKGTELRTTLSRMAQGHTSIHPKQAGEAIDHLLTKGDEALPQVIEAVTNYGPTKKYTDALTADIMSGDPGAIKKAAGQVAAILNTPGRRIIGLDDLITDERGMAVYIMSDGLSEEQLKTELPELNANLDLVNGKVRGHWAGRFNTSEKTSGADTDERARVGAAGIRHFLKTRFDGMSDEALEALGLPGLASGDLENVSAQVMQRFSLMLDVASVATAHKSDPQGDYTWNKFLKIAKGDFEVSHQRGKNVINIRTTPRVVLTQNPVTGNLQERVMEPWKTEDIDNALSDTARNYPSMDDVGLMRDPRTAKDGSMLYTMSTDTNSETPMVIKASSSSLPYQGIPESMANGMFALVMGDVREDDDGVWASVKRPGDSMLPDELIDADEAQDRVGAVIPEEFMVDHRTKLVFNHETDSWEARALAGPKLPESNEPGAIMGFFRNMWGLMGGDNEESTPDPFEPLKDATGVEKLVEMAKNDDPILMSDEDLMAQFDTPPQTSTRADGTTFTFGAVAPMPVIREWMRREKQRKMGEATGISSLRSDEPVPPGYGEIGEPIPMTEDEVNQSLNDVGAKAVGLGGFSPESFDAAKDAPPEERLLAMTKAGQAEGSHFDDTSAKGNSSLMSSTMEYVQKSNAWKPQVNSDPITGAPVVGFGFSLTRDDAEEALASVGAPPVKDIMNGEPIDHAQAIALSQYVLAENATFLKKHFKGTPLSRHQLKALMGLAYSSEWEDKPGGYRGPIVVDGPLTTAIRSGDTATAAHLIENSLEGVPDDKKVAVKARRALEADMFVGLNERDNDSKVRMQGEAIVDHGTGAVPQNVNALDAKFEGSRSKDPMPSKRFELFMDDLLEFEGGFNDIPQDRGGKTNFGISQRSYPDLDIKNLTKEQANEIYLRDFYLRVKGDQLPAAVSKVVFDYAVNSGVGAAAKRLQRIVGVKADGIIGPQTIKAVMKHDPKALALKLLEARARHIEGIIEGDSDQSVFKKGWNNRLEKLKLSLNDM
jgi:hypothetical protein